MIKKLTFNSHIETIKNNTKRCRQSLHKLWLEICKIQNSIYNPISETFGKNSMSYGEYNLDLITKLISHKSVDKFVKDLNIGELHLIEGQSGVTRTVTSLTTMMIAFNFKESSRRENAKWFKSNLNHFIVELSDDGAPESSERTMTNGTLSHWNFGNSILSRDYHHLLHMLTAYEKDQVCEYLWQQYLEEMLIGGNMLMTNGTQCTFKFVCDQPILLGSSLLSHAWNQCRQPLPMFSKEI